VVDVPSNAVEQPYRVVVLAGGEPLPPERDPGIAKALDRADLSIAADGGIRHAHRVDRDPDMLIGDLDSITADDLRRAEAASTTVLRHPTTKDATDLELALDLASTRTADMTGVVEVLVVGGHGGRTDHLLGNMLLLSAPRYAELQVSAWCGADVLHIVHDALTLAGPVGSTVSLLAVHGPASRVTTDGLRYPLSAAELLPGSSLGISNVITATPARISVGGGVLIVVHSPSVGAA